jgi:hypothetical protein
LQLFFFDRFFLSDFFFSDFFSRERIRTIWDLDLFTFD